MISAHLQYLQLLAVTFRARARGDDELEDRVLDQLDEVWRRLPADDLARVRELSRKIARGDLSEAAFVRTMADPSSPHVEADTNTAPSPLGPAPLVFISHSANESVELGQAAFANLTVSSLDVKNASVL